MGERWGSGGKGGLGELHRPRQWREGRGIPLEARAMWGARRLALRGAEWGPPGSQQHTWDQAPLSPMGAAVDKGRQVGGAASSQGPRDVYEGKESGRTPASPT